MILTNAKLLLGGLDLSGDANQVALALARTAKDATTFGSGGVRVNAAGLKEITAHAEGIWAGGAGAIDAIAFAALDGGAQQIFSVYPTGVDGEIGYAVQPVVVGYRTGERVGEILPFAFDAQPNQSRIVRPTLLGIGAKATTANGTARQLGAVLATQRAYAVLHVLAVSGTTPTLDVTIASDDAIGFGTPTTRFTFTQAIAVGAQWMELAGAITDDWWRATWTIGGTDNPSFTIAVGLAIQ